MVQAPYCPVDYAPGINVLVVEDEVMIRMAIAEEMRACGFGVWEAASAPAAVEVIEEGAAVDVVFSDVHMPGRMNGLGLARWILAHHPHVKVVLTSAAFSRGELPAELSSSVRMVAKPYELYTVLQAIRLCQEGGDGSSRGGAVEARYDLQPHLLRAAR